MTPTKRRRVKRKSFEADLLEANQPYLILDTETGGLNSETDSLIELSYAIIVNRFIPVRRQLYMNHRKRVSDKALEINGIERSAIKGFMSHTAAAHLFIDDLAKVADPYKQEEMIVPVGHNISFDLGFVRQWMEDANESEFYWLFLDEDRKIDTLELARTARRQEWILTPNAKLGTIAEYFGCLREDAHTARVDVEMTIDILERLLKLFRDRTQQ